MKKYNNNFNVNANRVINCLNNGRCQELFIDFSGMDGEMKERIEDYFAVENCDVRDTDEQVTNEEIFERMLWMVAGEINYCAEEEGISNVFDMVADLPLVAAVEFGEDGEYYWSNVNLGKVSDYISDWMRKAGKEFDVRSFRRARLDAIAEEVAGSTCVMVRYDCLERTDEQRRELASVGINVGKLITARSDKGDAKGEYSMLENMAYSLACRAFWAIYDAFNDECDPDTLEMFSTIPMVAYWVDNEGSVHEAQIGIFDMYPKFFSHGLRSLRPFDILSRAA